ncbi:MAG: hypothetical protein ACKO9T_11285, partial [Nitrospira sp.]
MSICVLLTGMAGCVQPSDLVKQDKDQSAKLAKARADLDQMIGEARASFKQELATLREEDLPQLRGNLDKGANRFDAMQRRLDDVDNKTSARLNVLEKIQHDQANLLKTERDRTHGELVKLAETVGTLARTVDARLDGQDKQLAQLGQVLTEFKVALTKFSDKLT